MKTQLKIAVLAAVAVAAVLKSPSARPHMSTATIVEAALAITVPVIAMAAFLLLLLRRARRRAPVRVPRARSCEGPGCGAPLGADTWEIEAMRAGLSSVHQFCSQRCLETWRAADSGIPMRAAPALTASADVIMASPDAPPRVRAGDAVKPVRCRCGHARHAHLHWRTGSDCALCECPGWRRRWPWQRRAATR